MSKGTEERDIDIIIRAIRRMGKKLIKNEAMYGVHTNEMSRKPMVL